MLEARPKDPTRTTKGGFEMSGKEGQDVLVKMAGRKMLIGMCKVLTDWFKDSLNGFEEDGEAKGQ